MTDSKWTGWKDAAMDALIVTGVATGMAYLGIDKMAASLASTALMSTGLMIPSAILRPIIFGWTVGTTVFAWDIIQLYRRDYS